LTWIGNPPTNLYEPTILTNQIQPYLLGDMIKFSSVVRISKRDEPVFISDVTVLVEFEQSKTQDIWQEADSELFELPDKYLLTYTGNRSGTTVIKQRKILASRGKGIVKRNETRRIYAISGVRLTETQLELELVSTSLTKA
jgi:hypothetical protein